MVAHSTYRDRKGFSRSVPQPLTDLFSLRANSTNDVEPGSFYIRVTRTQSQS